MPKKILILDTGKEWGGGTNSLLEFLRRSDSSKYQFIVLFYHNVIKSDEYSIKSEVEKLGMQFMTLKRRSQPSAVKALKELGRTLLFFSKKLKRKFIFYIDYIFRIKN
ncbi:MAG TPA: glycosyltransferase, partial [Nitrospirae bacterium]|nr:glycosyltransferase [Nitrospirota bacterium]